MACEDVYHSQSRSLTETPPLIIRDDDETMHQLKSMENVKLSTDELASEFYHPTVLTCQGTIFNFINSSCPGAASIIGALRCNLTEAQKIPIYVEKNKNKIKIHAVNALERHFRESQCAMGAGENLTLDDYGITFAIASVTPQGAALNPFKRHEGPLHYCLFPNLCEATVMKVECWDDHAAAEVAYIVNVYIHLLPLNQRRNRILQKFADDNVATSNRTEHQERKKAKLSPPDTTTQRSTLTYGQKKDAEAKLLREENAALKAAVAKLERQHLPSPPLPPTRGLVWPPKQANDPEMPDDV